MNTVLTQSLKRYGWKVIALVVFLVLQYQLWFDQSGLLANWKMQSLIEQRKESNAEFQAKNQVLTEEIIALRSGMDSLEAKARKELGMIKSGETYFIVVEGQD
ncbi:cell division protein FtsB [Bermanella marisrubri]|uniref:Cell division protein FtsB n=1 Tax=Bermanella marisrubri TaxID=207949 RepID=Q1N1K8_9GAMM|nr:septum formation initiator family protein [Bermanella marisrubri]EAT12042.1 Septum formation initiator [Oceanobacter sp. RED65] [Bermanella marisrubri]QIZ83515.1 cell division protein FtsB [Bermanella marisrubri]